MEISELLWRWLWFLFFFFKQKTAYEMRISDWSSDVCSSDLAGIVGDGRHAGRRAGCSRLQHCVLLAGRSGLLRLRQPEIAGREHLEAVGRQQRRILAVLALVVGGQHHAVAGPQAAGGGLCLFGFSAPSLSEERRLGTGCVSTC